jgi:hypothetical protein
VQEAAKKVELHLLKEAETKVASLVDAAKEAAKTKGDLEEALAQRREEVVALENVEGDPLPSAEVMARELTRIFGRNELSFELLPDGKHYRVTRHGQPARDLSTGERTAITLIHFLESVKRAYTGQAKPLIVIDDPVSSLDGGSAMGISTYIWSEGARVKVRSSYHHAFITAARAHIALAEDSTMEKKLDAQLLYPNVLRRMLETFLAFKSPTTVGNFTTAMRDHGAALEAAGYKGDADALRLHLTRFTHTNSHANSPETDLTVGPDEVGAIIAAVFTFMSVLDPAHFAGLCEVVGVDPSDLLIEVPVVVDHTTD